MDLFPPSDRDPQGILRAIRDEVANDAFELPATKRLTAVSYDAAAYIDPLAVGDELPSMRLFLAAGEHVPVPLEATCQATWSVCPPPIRAILASATPAKPWPVRAFECVAGYADDFSGLSLHIYNLDEAKNKA